MTTLIKNGLIITMDRQGQVFDKGWLVVSDDRIADMGPGCPPETIRADKIIDASKKAVLPGLINTHTHVCGSLFKAMTEDVAGGFYSLALPMEDMLTPEYTYTLSLLGSAECLKAGVTCINDIYHYMRDTARAVDEIGMRGVLAHKIIECNLSKLQYNDYTRTPKEAEARVEENIRLIEEYHNKDGRIFCKFGPHATDTISVELAKRIVDLGHKYDVGFHIHVAQKVQEVDFLKETYNLTPIEYLCETGLMGENLVAAHCIYITDNDIRLLSEGKAVHTYCAEMSAKRGDKPPIKKMLSQNVNMVFGTDWVTMDPWTDMRIAIMMARLDGCDLPEMNAHTALSKFTNEAAKALGLGDTVGSLVPGKQADIILVDMQTPALVPVFDNPVATLVYNANRNDVDTVMVAGRILVQDKTLKSVDEQLVLKEGQEVATSIYNKYKATR